MDFTYIHKQFLTLTRLKRYSDNHTSILLSISGGQDSLSLLKLTSDLTQYYNWQIGLVYFDHKSRNDSYFNLKQFLNISRTRRLKSYIYENFLGTDAELEYREWRYKMLLRIASNAHYYKIFTAHTLTDAIETFIHHIFRGCSIDSLANINSNTQHSIDISISILRPLLYLKRIDTAWFCRRFCLPLWSDYTNYQCKKTRNRLREELIPYVQQYFQPKIHSKIGIFLQNVHLDMEYLRQITIKLYFLVKHPSFIAINYSILLDQPKALQYRVLRLFLKHNFNIVLDRSIIYYIIDHLVKKKQIITLTSVVKFRLFLDISWLYVLAL